MRLGVTVEHFCAQEFFFRVDTDGFGLGEYDLDFVSVLQYTHHVDRLFFLAAFVAALKTDAKSVRNPIIPVCW